nr:putative ORF1 [Marmot picobirnavirus]
MMTQNQIRFQEYLETGRHNVSTETETNRANVAREQETHRSNVANEVETNRHNQAVESETNRHNVVGENLDRDRYYEQIRQNTLNYNLALRNLELARRNQAEIERSNRANESIRREQQQTDAYYKLSTIQNQAKFQQAQISETQRHNQAEESIKSQYNQYQRDIANINAELSRMQVEVAQTNAATSYYDAYTRRKKLEIDRMNAETQRMQAGAAMQQAEAAMTNAYTNMYIRPVTDLGSNVIRAGATTSARR